MLSSHLMLLNLKHWAFKIGRADILSLSQTGRVLAAVFPPRLKVFTDRSAAPVEERRKKPPTRFSSIHQSSQTIFTPKDFVYLGFVTD